MVGIAVDKKVFVKMGIYLTTVTTRCII